MNTLDCGQSGNVIDCPSQQNYNDKVRSGLVLAVLLLVGCADEPLIDIDRSIVEVDRTEVVADGVDTVSLTITVLSGSGAGIAGCIVDVVSEQQIMVVESSAPTDNAGRTTARVTSTVADLKSLVVTAQKGNGPPVALLPSEVVFVAGPVARLGFVTPPSDGIVGTMLPTVAVAFWDAYDNVVRSESATIDVKLKMNGGGVQLAGTTTVAATAGVATFVQLMIADPIGDAVIEASTLALPMIESTAFDVVLGPPSPTLTLLTAAPSNMLADGIEGSEIIVFVRNAGGHVIPNYPVSVSATGTANTFYPVATGITDLSGRFTARLTSTVAESKTLTLTAGSVVLSAAVTFTSPPCTPRLPGRPNIEVPEQIAAMRTVDVDGDGHKDLVVAEQFNLAILRGTGLGTFHPAVRYVSGNMAQGSRANGLAYADFNQDGRVDVVVSTSSPDLKVFLGVGSGMFAAAVSVTVGVPLDVTTGDFDKNGTVDLAVRINRQIVVRLGNGDGTFNASTSYQLGDPSASISAGSIGVADLNNDTYPDLYTNAVNNYSSALLNTTSGAFQSALTTAGTPSGHLAFANVDGNTTVDVVTGTGWRPGNGDGTFGAPLILSNQLSARAAVDMNGDGSIDIVGGGYATGFGYASVFHGDGVGSFGPERYTGVTSGAGAVAVADFDEDGRLDVAVAHGFSSSRNAISILSGSGTATGLVGSRFYGDMFGPGRAHFSGAVGDFNGNGTVDFVAVSDVYEQLGVQLADGNLNLTAMPLVAGVESGPPDLVADFNKDGRLDVLAVEGDVRWYAGNGDGTLAPAVALTTGAYAQKATTADIDGDGNLDLAMTLSISSSVAIARGNGNGTFGAVSNYSTGGQPAGIDLVDINEDGELDLLVAARQGGVRTFLGVGDGTFTTSAAFAMNGASSIVASDVSGDGHVDLIVANDLFPWIGYYEGNGDGTFDLLVQLPAGTTSWVGLLDVDGNGLEDIIAKSDGLIVVRNLGNGLFRQALHYNSAFGSPPALFDFNGDGRKDVMVATEVGFSIADHLACQ